MAYFFILFYEYEEDQSGEAVGLSYAPLLKMITNNIITENSDNTITVNLGFNEFIHISKTANLRIDTCIDSTNPHMHLLKISIEAVDEFGNKISEIREIPVSGLKYVFHFKENTTSPPASPGVRICVSGMAIALIVRFLEIFFSNYGMELLCGPKQFRYQ